MIVTSAAMIAASCAPPGPTGEPPKAPTPAEAFDGVGCGAVRPQTEPDLMAWDPVSRAVETALRNLPLSAIAPFRAGEPQQPPAPIRIGVQAP